MANAADVNGIDTDSLLPSQLSDDEWNILLQIEQRLSEVSPEAPRDGNAGRDWNDAKSSDFAPPYLAKEETRYQRVLLLDGGRGTGKTSLLLTFIRRWHGAAGAMDAKAWLSVEQEARLSERRRSIFPDSTLQGAPKNIRVIRNLDFDPLPPGMPLVAGIVQAWRPLAEHYDRKTFPSDELCDNLDARRRLMDLWHSLFRMAAGWSAVSGAKGLIEQVLDQEEQVRDWQDLRGKWLWFINEVIRVGRGLKSERLDNPPIFVIVIDDVDLQVERIRELLPALRLLAHENVFFLIAADRAHMLDMLQLEFLGQQRKLATGGSGGGPLPKTAKDWAVVLANAAFEKVFPTRNRWALEKLSLSAVLEFPWRSNAISESLEPRSDPGGQTFERLLETIKSKGGAAKASAVISNLATAAEQISLELPALSYRSAQQLWQAVVPGSDSKNQAAKVLARLVEINLDARAVVRRDDAKTIEVPAIGELTAFYRPGFVAPGEYDIVVSAQPDFWFISTVDEITSMRESLDDRFNFTAGLIAKTLQERQFHVDATALKWETYLSLAWTTWRDVPATFAWTWHKHPRPDELLVQTKKWASYVTNIYERKDLSERHAYAWIYFERQRSLNKSKAPNPTKVGEREKLPWEELLKFPDASKVGEEQSADIKTWQTITLPLLARPEIGLPPHVQDNLLRQIGNNAGVRRALRFQRRRLLTDAVFAEGLQRRKVRNDLPSEEDVNRKIQYIDQRYAELNVKPSPWVKNVEQEQVRQTARKAKA